MSLMTEDDWHDYLDEQDGARRGRHTTTGPAPTAPEEVASLTDDDLESSFHPSFTGSRHEREWILTYLGPFHADALITDVLRVVKGGKEATVYACAAHPSTGLEMIAAKVYRPKAFRTFKNDADYKSGRPLLDPDGKEIRDSRIMKAVAQGTRTGEAASHASWLAHEFSTIEFLHALGADVPRPVALGENAMLMSYLGDEHEPAPTLSEVRIPLEEAHALFHRLMRNVELMLEHDRIHGDLSAYNVLYWDGDVTIIDFPQVIDAYRNSDAFRFLQRDVERLCDYFARYGIRSDARRIAGEMWRRAMPDETRQVRGSRW